MTSQTRIGDNQGSIKTLMSPSHRSVHFVHQTEKYDERMSVEDFALIFKEIIRHLDLISCY